MQIPAYTYIAPKDAIIHLGGGRGGGGAYRYACCSIFRIIDTDIYHCITLRTKKTKINTHETKQIN